MKRDGPNRIKTIYIEPGSPWLNGFVESFYGRFWDECLNREQLWTLTEARVVTGASAANIISIDRTAGWAITAMAHKLARVLWHLLKYKEAYDPNHPEIAEKVISGVAGELATPLAQPVDLAYWQKRVGRASANPVRRCCPSGHHR